MILAYEYFDNQDSYLSQKYRKEERKKRNSSDLDFKWKCG